jgi:hypothetical protein
MAGASQAIVAVGLLVASIAFAVVALRAQRGGEFWWMLSSIALTADTLVVQRARVLTVPLAFVVILIALFWSARRAAEREE